MQGLSHAVAHSSHHSIHSTATASNTNKSNIPLAQRLLHPSNPSIPLPPILLSNPSNYQEVISQLNNELYDLIALSLRAYISSLWWHTYISPRDKSFLPEINLTITHILQALEQRLLDVANLPNLFFHTLPILLIQHYKDYRSALSKLSTSYYAPSPLQGSTTRSNSTSTNDLAHIFHSTQPHLGVDEFGSFNDTYLRQIIDHILKATLPPDDYQSDLERSIIREILVKPLLGSAVLPTLSQPWFLHSIALSFLGVPLPIQPHSPPPPPPLESESTSNSTSISSILLPHNILISLLTCIQSISTTCLTIISFFQTTFTLIYTINTLPSPSSTTEDNNGGGRRLNKGNMNFEADRKAVEWEEESSSSSSSPSRGIITTGNDDTDIDIVQPIVELTAQVFKMRERTASTALLIFIKAITIYFKSFFNKLLLYTLKTNLLTPPRIVQLVQLSKKTLFPLEGGWPGPSPEDPSLEQQLLMKDALEDKILEMIPSSLRPYLLGPPSPATRTTQRKHKEAIRDMLEPLSGSKECNAHLVMLVFEAVVLALFPEMGVVGGSGGGSGRSGRGGRGADDDDSDGLGGGVDVDVDVNGDGRLGARSQTGDDTKPPSASASGDRLSEYAIAKSPLAT
ncbi:uncharacterized protein EI90DRAFT_3118704 [Cantharellus anzutake]|uniref:uncharacterized protein n=1 Tax=Cantharellus anzutake TaxID=1750568 RepID=UPI0019070A4C|nr:uncharacterized protein EI90DRAFT_3118704 [Cantharellus anzutake]KAF8338307.1 hypothetical protein EI90DRAFT_3118704 [Cantharellus anzutake]